MYLISSGFTFRPTPLLVPNRDFAFPWKDLALQLVTGSYSTSLHLKIFFVMKRLQMPWNFVLTLIYMYAEYAYPDFGRFSFSEGKK
jgi:hypothetical protein